MEFIIKLLPSVSISDTGLLPKIGGVYFVVTPINEIEYIGKAVNIRRRWYRHNCLDQIADLKGYRIYWKEISDEQERRKFEKETVVNFKPRININFQPRDDAFDPSIDFWESEDEKLLTTQEAAQMLGLSDSRVRRMILDGIIPAVKFGQVNMIKRADAEKVVVHGKRGRPKKQAEK